MKSFITGSRAYGKPNQDSDIDIVVFCDVGTKCYVESELGYPVKAGNVNLIMVDDENVYKMWWEGTEHLKSIGPVDRETAIDYFDSIGIKRLYPKGVPSGGQQ